MQEEPIEKKFEKAFTQAVAANPVFPYLAKQQMGKMVEAIVTGNKNINSILTTNQTAPVKGGYIAEEWIAETFNLDSILKDSDAVALTDRYGDWNSQQWQGQNLGKNDIPDIVVVKGGKVTTTGQAKFYASPEETTKQMSQVKDGQPKYKDVDQLIGPEDQVNPKHGEYSISEHAEAKSGALESTGGSQAEIDAYKQTEQKNSSTLTDGDSSSTPLDKSDADAMGNGDLRKLKKVENEYQTRSTVKQMGKAASNAAAMSAVISGSINTITYIQQARDGKITAGEAVVKIVAETAASAADSAVKASANVGVQSLMVRYGTEKVLISTLAKQGVKSMLRTNAVTVGVVCAVDAIKDLVRLGMGDISQKEFYEKQGKNVLNTSAGVAGGTIGAIAGESVAVALGLASTAPLAIAGGLVGGLIVGLAMNYAIENGIEKPYRELLQNTSDLHDAVYELERVSQTMFAGQIIFGKILEADGQLEEKLQDQFYRIDVAGKRALDAINKI